MTLDEALSEAITGSYVRHDGMQPGSFIYYNFNGWRIQFLDIDGDLGSSSGWSAREGDEAANWYEHEHKRPQPVAEPWPDAPAPVEPKRRRRRSQEPLPPVNDIGDWQAPQKPVNHNPWAEAGIGQPPKQQGWADYGTGQG